MRGRRSMVAAVALVVALAVAGTAANLFLLRLTQSTSDPVGRLSPRAVFSSRTTTSLSPTPAPPPVATTDEQHRAADD